MPHPTGEPASEPQQPAEDGAATQPSRPVTPSTNDHDDAVHDDGAHPVGQTRRTPPAVLAALVAVVALALVAGLLLWHPWSTKKGAQPQPTGGGATPSPTPSSYGQVLDSPSRMFTGGNVYVQDITQAPVDPNSSAIVANLQQQVKKFSPNHQANLNFDQYNGSFWPATKGTAPVDVGFSNCQHKKNKAEYHDLVEGPKYLKGIPIPSNAVPAKGTDGHLAVWSQSQDKLWELWKATKKNGHWSACWAGRIDNVSRSVGQYPSPYGVSASGLSVVGSMVSVEEAKKLQIDHAVGLNIPGAAVWPSFSYPANRTDGGSKETGAPPEGTRLRLDPSVDVDSLNIQPLAKAIAKAAQKYGLVISDKSGVVSVVTEDGNRRMVNAEGARVAANPWSSILKGTQGYSVLTGFPWDKLQVVQKDWGKPAEASSSSGSS